MKARGHVVMFLLCFAGTIAFYYLGLIWMIGDFHPSGDETFNPELRQRAELGESMAKLFMMPIMALMKEPWSGIVLILSPLLCWVLAAFYAGLIHLLLWGLIAGFWHLPRREAEPSEPF